MTHEEIDYEAREAMQALRGKLSARATSSEFNEWMAREICEYIDHLLQAQRWRPIDEEAKNGKPHLFLCRWQDQVGFVEEQIVLRWEIDGWFDWDSVKLDESIPVAYLPLPPSSFEEPTTEATPSGQPGETDHDTNPSHDG